MLVHLLRHGETTADVESRYGGDYDDHLTEHGREEVHRRVKRLPTVKVLISSPRIRAQETADIIAKEVKLPVHTERDWRERNAFGILTGMLESEAKQQHPELVEQLADYKNTLPEAEPYEDFKARVLAALNDLTKRKEGDILVVTHSGPIRCILREVLGCELQEIHNCAIVSLQHTASGWHFVTADGVVFSTLPTLKKKANLETPPFEHWRGSTY